MRRLVFSLLLVCVLLPLASCVPGPSENEVTFWHAMGRWEDDLLAIIDEFNKLHPEMPVKAYNMSRYQALSQKIIAAVAAGQPPTISQAYESWTAEMMEGGIVECLQPYADGENGLSDFDWGDYRQVFLDECTYEGKLWSFPFNKSVRTLFYNRDLFAATGLDPDNPPRTWDELRDQCQQLTEDFDGDGTPDQWGISAKSSVTFFGNLLLQNGGNFFSDDGKVSTIDSPEGIEAMQYMWDLLGSRKIGYSTFDYAFQNEFKAGKVGMMESSSVSLSFLRGRIDFELGVAPLPGRKLDRAMIQGTNLVVFNKATDAQKRTAWEFIKFLTNTENATRWAMATGYAPVRKSCLAVPEMKVYMDAVPGLQESYDQLETAQCEPSNAAWFAGRKYLEEGAIQRVMRGSASPAEALRKTAAKINNEIESGF
ncbi:MAG: ABC transporter substrate-binding protein [bacterium]|nr:ABC transporter substrate-binding protein [bacterium]